MTETETTLFGGTLLDTPEKRAAALAQGAEHVRICASCEREFYTANLKSSICWGCWYSLEMQTSENGFKPLSTWLERLLETETRVDQTGGMVMCLRVDVGHDRDERGDSRRFVYFSETPGDPDGFGYYEYDEDGDMFGDGEMFTPPAELLHVCGGGPCGWYHHPEHAEAIARWAAPLIVGLAAGADR